MAHEFKDGLKKYFTTSGVDKHVKDLEDAINQTLLDSIEMMYFNLDRMKNAQSKESLIESTSYQEAVKHMKTLTGELGIDRVMTKHNLDAFVSPTGSPAWKTDLINGDKYYISTTVFAALLDIQILMFLWALLIMFQLGYHFLGLNGASLH